MVTVLIVTVMSSYHDENHRGGSPFGSSPASSLSKSSYASVLSPAAASFALSPKPLALSPSPFALTPASNPFALSHGPSHFALSPDSEGGTPPLNALMRGQPYPLKRSRLVSENGLSPGNNPFLSRNSEPSRIDTEDSYSAHVASLPQHQKPASLEAFRFGELLWNSARDWELLYNYPNPQVDGGASFNALLTNETQSGYSPDRMELAWKLREKARVSTGRRL